MDTLLSLYGGRWRLASGRGKTATILTLFVVIFGTAGANDHGASLLLLIVFSPLVWWWGWWVLGFFGGFWAGLVEGSPPEGKVGRPWQSSGTRKQLRQDGNARVFEDRGGILFRRRLWFIASGTPPIRLDPAYFAMQSEDQEATPQFIASHRDRLYWRFQDSFYWTNEQYAATDIKALLFARERQRQRELEHAHALMAAGSSPAVRKREPIPKDVKLAVFRRDEGKCVECGSDFDIQYDHIIPFTMGGANTVENLQLLCARCNQQKGGRI